MWQYLLLLQDIQLLDVGVHYSTLACVWHPCPASWRSLAQRSTWCWPGFPGLPPFFQVSISCFNVVVFYHVTIVTNELTRVVLEIGTLVIRCLLRPGFFFSRVRPRSGSTLPGSVTLLRTSREKNFSSLLPLRIIYSYIFTFHTTVYFRTSRPDSLCPAAAPPENSREGSTLCLSKRECFFPDYVARPQMICNVQIFLLARFITKRRNFCNKLITYFLTLNLINRKKEQEIFYVKEPPFRTFRNIFYKNMTY